MAGSVHVHASVLGKAEASHSVWVEDTAPFGAAILDLVGSGVTVAIGDTDKVEKDCITVKEMAEAFGYLKYAAKGKR